MSLSYDPIKPVVVLDPVMAIKSQRDYAVLKCGSQTSWKRWISSSVSLNTINWSCPPPSAQVVVNRKMYVYLPVRLRFSAAPGAGNRILSSATDCPRAFPIASSLETIQLSLNNQSVSFNCADVIQALLRYNTGEELKNGDYSMTPNYMDQSQNYNDLANAMRDPIGMYGDALESSVQPRGSFPFAVIDNPAAVGGETITAVIDIAVCEPLFISPLYFGSKNAPGLYGVSSMDLTLNFVSQLANRWWSHNNVATNITASSFVFGGMPNGPTTPFVNGQQPMLLVQYITPSETFSIPPNMPLTYSYFDVQRFETPIGAVPAQAPGTYAQHTSNSIQLSTIPRKVYVYVRRNNFELHSNPAYTDTYFQIESISMQFMNQSGIFSSASQLDLYKMSRKNGCNIPYNSWSGEPLYRDNWHLGPVLFSGVGSVICMEFASDVGLSSLDAPGKNSQSTLQISVKARNCSGNLINASLYIVVVNEGTFTIPFAGQATTQIGVLTSEDILNAQKQPFYVNYYDLTEAHGGDFWSGLKEFGNKINDFLKDTQIISRLANSSLGMMADTALSTALGVPLPVASTIGKVAEYYGYGQEGGVLLGGKALKRKDLVKRLK